MIGFKVLGVGGLGYLGLGPWCVMAGHRALVNYGRASGPGVGFRV